tara:strand:- start:361 stop:1359 length:999 start_codon:yes stop_codon:yes gene_type:complete
MDIEFEAIAEFAPGPKWQALFNRHWPAYHKWFLSEGDAERTPYLASVRQLRTHMPELLPTYERLVELAGGGDAAARFLSLYRPPPYLSGCSQAVWLGTEPFLVRNYDYSPRLCEGTVLYSQWNGRKVMAMVDCLWGAVDGMNDSGLVVSLTFGGRRVVGDGFGVPVILRYILETCDTTAEAELVLRRVPTHMSYNVTVLDRFGNFRTAFLAPDRPPEIRPLPIATNHQGRVEWHAHARATATLEREQSLFFRLADSEQTGQDLIEAFHQPPLFSTGYQKGFGTLYTTVYWPLRGLMELRWPGQSWYLSFDDFAEGVRTINYDSGFSGAFVRF